MLEFDQPTASAAEAACAIGCSVEQIAKSLVFANYEGDPILVIASGASRVDEAKVGQMVKTTVYRPDADFVKRATGFSIGGVPAVGHSTQLTVVLDQRLQDFEEIWAEGGTPTSVFCLTPNQLRNVMGASLRTLSF